ncbi:four helix bundle protein [Nafulsella turpanensis]|uniref:four helix bundle protein n=1 Tax=Nafulsella turpanensis TaxID=1265690 RepID=UPI00036BC55A|nr:four helix bundle protein [Nafulsella turpanensis]
MSQLQYTDLDVWQVARKLVKEVYVQSRAFPKEEAFGLTSQIRRAAISVPSNIAEGCGRSSSKESVHFYFIARGSLYELETQLFLALDMGFLSHEAFESLIQQAERCKKLLNGFIRYFKAKYEQPSTNN